MHCYVNRGLIVSAIIRVEAVLYLTRGKFVRSGESQEYINMYRNFYRMMLCFKRNDCRISGGSTWYDRMDSLLMALGFTESKADSNLFFKVEGGRPLMLLLYVYDLFLTRKRNSLDMQEGDLLSSSR